MDHADRRRRLAAGLEELDAQAFLVTRLPNVRYVTGFSGSNGQLILTANDALFLTDGRYAEQSRREVPDVRRALYSGDFVPAVATACADLGVRRVAFEGEGVTYKVYTNLAGTGLDLLPTTQEIERLRWVKDPGEIGWLEAAQAITDDAFEMVAGKLVEGMTERDVALELDVQMRRFGAPEGAFQTIVAFGENAAEPHHRPTDRQLRKGDVVKLDFGCVVEGYHSDMTRTVAFGDPGQKLREVYEVVRRAQHAGVDAVRAGVTGGDADAAAREVIREAGFGEQFRHSLGHGVGLEIHEGPSLRHAGMDVLPENAVVTVEPGIYVEGVGGVRIEDMVVVGADGCRVMPRTPKDLIVL